MESIEVINQFTRASYNKAAEKYYELFHNELEKKKFDKKFIDEYLELLNPGSTICSAGCGPCGHIERYIHQKGFNVIGIDISEKCIEIAKSRNPGIRFEAGDFLKLNFKNNYLDGLVSYYSIIDSPRIYLHKIFTEFNRVLKKNGLFMLVVKEGNSEGYQEELLGIKTRIYFSLFTLDEIKTYLEEGGFYILKILKRNPYRDEIKTNRIFAICRKK